VFQPVYAAYLNLIYRVGDHRAVVEGAAFAGLEGPTLRDLGRDRAGRGSGDGVLERAPSPVRLGPQAPAPTQAQAGSGRYADGGLNFATLTGCTTKRINIKYRRITVSALSLEPEILSEESFRSVAQATG